MSKHACPSCSHLTITNWQKLCVGPANEIACPNCGARLSVPLTQSMILLSLTSFLPPLGSLATFLLAPQGLASGALLALVVVGGTASLVISCWLYAIWVPLVVSGQA